MKNKTNQIEINTQSTHSVNSDYDRSQIISLNEIKHILRSGITIVDINENNISLLSQIDKYLKSDYQLIEYIPDLQESIHIRQVLDKQNMLVINSNFVDNGLKNNIVDLILGKNILGEKENIHKNLKQINRVLNDDGSFVFVELLSFEKPLLGFRSHFKKQPDHMFNLIIYNIDNIMKKIKNCKYELKIIGNGNYYFDNEIINSLQEFCDIYGYDSEDRNIILSSILLVVIKGNKK